MMTNFSWSPDIRERIAKLIRMLSSASDGEIIAAARAISRALVNEGADIHDLAALVRGASPAAVHNPGATRSQRSAAPAKRKSARFDSLTKNVWLVSCAICVQHASKLSASELAFIRSLEERLKSERPCTFSEIKKLDRICGRFEQRGK